MANGTVDNLNIQLSADANRAVQSLNSLKSTLNSISTAFAKDISGMRKFSKEIGTLSASMQSLSKIKFSAPDMSGMNKMLKSLNGMDASGAKKTADGIEKVVNSFNKLGNANFNDSGINKTVNALNRLFKVDTSKFNPNDFFRITDSIAKLGTIPDVSNGVNRFVSSLSRLANAGAKTGQSANSVLKLGQETKKAAEEMRSVGTINNDINLFVQSIARLASAGGKTAQTASGLGVLAQETLKFFRAMQKAPKISNNTLQMTQALAQLANAGGKVGTATNTVTSSFNKLSAVGNKTMSTIKKVASNIVSSFKQIGNSTNGINQAQVSLSNLIKTAVGFRGLYSFLNFGKQAFNLGSDITEVENVVDVAFGSMRDMAYEFAATTKEQFGISELSALKFSGTLMAMFNSSGIAQKQAAEMSTTLTGLAGDIASFYNISQEEAFTKIRAGMSGMVMPLRQIGIDMTVASISAYAMSQGITKSWQSMTQGEKQLLRYQYLLSVTSAQQGDFARTSWSWANQVRMLQLNIQALAATIGQGLISAVLPAVTALNKLFSVLQKAAVAVRNFFYVLTGFKGGAQSGVVDDLAGLGDTAENLGDLGSAGSDAAGGLEDADKAAKKLNRTLFGFDEMNVLNAPTEDSGTGGTGDAGGTGGLGGGDFGLDDGLLDLGDKDPEKYVSPWAERIRAAFLAEDWELLGEEIAWGLNKGLQKVYDVISWDNVGPKITAFTTAFTETFNSFANAFDFELLGRTIGTGINTVVNTLNQLIDGIDWKNLGKRFAVGFNGLVDEVDWFELGRLIGNKFMIAWDTLLGFVTTLDWGEVGRSLADGFNGMLQEISLGDIGTTIGTIVAGIIEMFREFFANVEWSEVISQIKEGLKNALIAASDGGKNDGILAGLLGIGAIAGLTKIIVPIVTAVDKLSKALGGSGLAKSIGTALKGVGGKTGLSGAFTALKTAIGAISAPVAIAVAAITAIAIGIKDLWDTSSTFRDSVSEMWDKIATAFSEAKTRIWDETLVPLGEQLSGLWDMIYSGYEESGLKDIFEQLVTLLGDQLSSRISEFIGIISNAFKTAGGIISGILTVLEGVITFVSGVFSGDWTQAWEGIEGIVKGVVDAISSFFFGLWETITIILSPVTEFFGEVFSSAYNKVTSIWQFISSWFTEKVKNPIVNIASGIGEGIENALKTAYDTVTSVWNGIESFFKGIANKAIKPIGKLVNGIIDGVNWIGDKLGVGKVLNNWTVPQFSSGSKGIQRDTFGVVNDQKGATYKELILPPNGKPFIPKGRNVMLPLQKGTKIMPAGQTEELMKLMKIPRFADGIGDFFGGAWSAIKSFAGDVWEYLTHPGDLVKVALDKFIKLGDFFEPWLTIAGGAINKLFNGIVEFVQGLFDKANPVVNYNPSAGVEQWRAVAAQALRMTGQYSESNLNLLLYQMQTESGGNPNAINNWDINAKNGTPSKGLMQVIDPTFQAYKMPGYNNIWDPLSNMLAAIRYTLSRYGSLANGWRGHGYAEGIGTITISDIFKNIPKLAGGGIVSNGQMFIANERGPELLGRYGKRTAVMNNDQIVGSVSDGVADGVYRAVLDAMSQTGGAGGDLHLTVQVGSERIIRQIVKDYNRIKKSDPNFGFVY